MKKDVGGLPKFDSEPGNSPCGFAGRACRPVENSDDLPAADHVPFVHLGKWDFLFFATILDQGASALELATRRRLKGAWYITLERLLFMPLIGVGRGYGRK